MSITDLKFEIDRESKTPLWLQIRNELFNCLYRDELRPGQLIPNEKTLVELFNVSIGTIRKAVGMLEKEGFLIRKQGLGTFVFQHDNNSFLFEYFHFALNGSNEKQSPNVEFISFESKKATKSQAAELGIAAGSPVFQIHNKLGLNKKFYIVDKIIIPQEKFPGLTEETDQMVVSVNAPKAVEEEPVIDESEEGAAEDGAAEDGAAEEGGEESASEDSAEGSDES